MANPTPSPELEAILKRWVAATVQGDGTVVRNLLSRDTGALYCGTGTDEVFTGQTLQDGIAAHIGEISDNVIDYDAYHSSAWGNAGWALAECHVRNSKTGNSLIWRLSAFFHLEDGVWKAHHLHGSYATDLHESLMGVMHSAFADLLASASGLDLQIGKTGSATLMFTDIVDSTSLAEALGDLRWAQEVNAHVQKLTELIEAEDGRMIKSLGDGTMSTFSSAGAGMRAAQAIQREMAQQTGEPHLRVRIGLHTGDVIESGDDFFGTVVNKAARVAAYASAGDILVSDATRVMVESSADLAFSDTAKVSFKGLDGQHLIHRLDWNA